jgi:chemotaxis protein methyltransferase CheR
MTDAECVVFLQWALPHLQLRWTGFRRVRKQVCKRIDRRLKELRLPDVRAYRSFLETCPQEWDSLDSACRITISRFYRDRPVFDHLGTLLLPGLAELASARNERSVRCWSVGCGSGEEPHTLAILWQLSVAPRFPHLRMLITATDVDSYLLQRARRAWYPASSLRDVPREWIRIAFDETPRGYRVRESFRRDVEFALQDLRRERPSGRFHLVLCRNLVFTYFEEALQREILDHILEHLEEGGILVIGHRETLPQPITGALKAWNADLGIYRKSSPG